MNLPNKLTLLRVCMIPAFLVFFFVEAIPQQYLWAFIVFVAASLTDMLDGYIARKYNLITDFGKLMDPLADKLLVMAAMVSLIPTGLVHAWVVAVILAREFFVTSIRQLAAAKGEILAADNWGKLKTIFQMIWISFDILYLFYNTELRQISQNIDLNFAAAIIHNILLAGVVVLTVVSGINYMWKNRSLLSDM